MENSMEEKIELSCDTIIPLLGIYPEKAVIQKHTCIPMFIAALFTAAKDGSDLNVYRQGMDNKMQYMYTMEYYSAIKKERKDAI